MMSKAYNSSQPESELVERTVDEEYTTIRVSVANKERLKKYGDMDMSYDDVVERILDRLEEMEDKDE